MTESKKIQLRTVGALSLSVVSSISIVICNKALITTLGFNFGAEWWAQQFGKSLPFLSWVPVINGMLLREKGILQHHQLIDEFENVVGEDGVMKELKESPFSQILKFAQMALFRGLVDNPYWCMEKNFHFCVELI
ncbi:hypothetical protein CsSME_00016807 [Camellia sinensis var. sinensis]|uniref:uncharacterized protein LOC114267073 n=1 Tax=Camellia sinensis TaxID=4442 RepID=UPI001036937C|nr:uncharacterized protein LOC114267073 [Camellia sinensis]XP_028063863.1 uncharacterized protein LOC114267073 [Camellia sinensis]